MRSDAKIDASVATVVLFVSVAVINFFYVVGKRGSVFVFPVISVDCVFGFRL